MKLDIRQCQRIYLPQPGEFFLILGRCYPEHLSVVFISFYLIREHAVIYKPAAPKGFLHQDFLFAVRIDAEFISSVGQSLSPCDSMYRRMVSIGAPPAVSRQKL